MIRFVCTAISFFIGLNLRSEALLSGHFERLGVSLPAQHTPVLSAMWMLPEQNSSWRQGDQPQAVNLPHDLGEQDSKMGLTRFRGHLNSWEKAVHDEQDVFRELTVQ